MSPELGLLIMTNNYMHDVATGLLLASGFALWAMLRIQGPTDPEPPVARYFLAIYKHMTRLAIFSLVWIILGGIPRLITYEEFEWANAAGRSQVPALIGKHILAFTFLGGGVYLWMGLRRRARAMRATLGDPS